MAKLVSRNGSEICSTQFVYNPSKIPVIQGHNGGVRSVMGKKFQKIHRKVAESTDSKPLIKLRIS